MSRLPSGRQVDPLTVALLPGALLLVYYVTPVVSLVLARPPLVVIRRLTTPTVLSAAATSVTASTTSTAVATGLGVPLAYWLARTEGPVTTVVTAAVVMPLVLPPVVSGMVLLTVVGPDTVLGQLAVASGIHLTRSLAGVVLAQTFVASPFVVITARAAFENIDPRLEEVSRSLGEGPLMAVRRVTLPLAWPGILAGITLAFARAMGEFGATIMLAFYPRTLPVRIWVDFSTRGLDAAFPTAVVLLGVSLAALIILDVLGAELLQ